MQLSVWPAAQHHWADTLALVRHCDATGWYGCWFEDHLMSPAGALDRSPLPTLEVWSALAGLAATTDRLRVGSLVASVTYRHPGITAAAALTIDEISAGRMVLGVGAGWQADEHEAYGIRLGGRAERSDRLEEGCAVIRSMLHDERTSFRGNHFTLDAATREPKGHDGRTVPLLIAGRGRRRTLRTAAEYADEWNAWAPPDDLVATRAVLDRHCEALDRDPSEISTSTQALLCPGGTQTEINLFREAWSSRPVIYGTDEQMRDQIGAYETAGADELILCDWGIPDPSRRIDSYDRVASLLGL